VSDHSSHPYYDTARDFHARPEPTERSTVMKKIRSDPIRGKPFDWRDYFGQYRLYYWVRSMQVISMVMCTSDIVARWVVVGYRATQAWVVYQAAAGEQEGYQSAVAANTGSSAYRISLAASLILEAAVLLFEGCGFLLFFPASIVMFGRVERKLDMLLQELSLRSDQGTAFLPFEFSPPATDGRSQTQTEMPIVEARQYLRDIKSPATLQWRRFCLCLVVAVFAFILESLHAILRAYSGFADRNVACPPCDQTCQTLDWLIFLWYTSTPELFPILECLTAILPLLLSLWLMTTPEDRAMLMKPHRFRSSSIKSNPVQSPREAQLFAERIRLGIYLQ
jgi:hypothetical protein